MANNNNKDVLHESVDTKKFQKQVRKFSNHHALPNWAADQLKVHIEHEVERRDKIQQSKPTFGMLFKPWQWKNMWQHRPGHLHVKGDIEFPKDSEHHHHAKSPSPSHSPAWFTSLVGGNKTDASPTRKPHSPHSPHSPQSPQAGPLTEEELRDEVTYMESGVTFMTDDLVEEIMNDDASTQYADVDVIEHAGAKPIDPWSGLGLLDGRSHLFVHDQVHENTIRSIALANPKPGDPRPGKTKLSTERQIEYQNFITITKYEESKAENAKRGIKYTKTIKMKNPGHINTA